LTDDAPWHISSLEQKNEKKGVNSCKIGRAGLKNQFQPRFSDKQPCFQI